MTKNTLCENEPSNRENIYCCIPAGSQVNNNKFRLGLLPQKTLSINTVDIHINIEVTKTKFLWVWSLITVQSNK